jgi:excisionase family DNA binding protein
MITETAGAALMTERRFLTPAEAATILRVSTDTVLRLISAGTLPAIRVSPRLIRIPTPAFEAYQAGRTPNRRRVVRRRRSTEVTLGARERVADPQPA